MVEVVEVMGVVAVVVVAAMAVVAVVAVVAVGWARKSSAPTGSGINADGRTASSSIQVQAVITQLWQPMATNTYL